MKKYRIFLDDGRGNPYVYASSVKIKEQSISFYQGDRLVAYFEGAIGFMEVEEVTEDTEKE